MKTRLMMLITTVLVAYAMGFAQETSVPTTYDLPAVITRALEANPTIRAARQQVATAEAKVDEARSARGPKVQGEAGYLQLADDPSFTVPPMGTLVFGQSDNPWLNVSMDWPIYSGGMIEGMIAASRHGVDAAWQGHARTQQEIAAEAATAYFQVLSARQMVEVMRQQVTILQEAVRVATGMREQGMVAKLDVLRPTSELASAQAMLTQAENGIQVATANLKRLLNLPSETAITVAPTPDVTPAPQAELATATRTALAQRPEMKRLQAYRQATEAQQEIARAGRRPQVGMHVQYDLERQTTFPEIGSWSVALVVRQPLYDGGASRAQLAAATSQRDELREHEAALRQGIIMQVTNALLTLQAAEKRVASAAQAQATADEAYAAATISYKNQVVPIIDVLGAQAALTQARVQLALAQFDRQTAQIQYHLALGELPGAAPTAAP